MRRYVLRFDAGYVTMSEAIDVMADGLEVDVNTGDLSMDEIGVAILKAQIRMLDDAQVRVQ